MNPTAGAADQDFNPGQVMQDLDRPPSDRLPVAALRAAQQHREAMIPPLIRALDNATERIAAGADVDGQAHFFALFLLTEFRATEALPAVVRALSLPGEGPFDLFGDTITECLYRILARIDRRVY